MSAEDRMSKLTPEEEQMKANLLAIFAAYDAAPASEQAKMEAAASGKDPDYVVPAETMMAGYAAKGIAQLTGKTTAQAGRDVRSLIEASEQIPAPGIKGMLGMFARRGAMLLGKDVKK